MTLETELYRNLRLKKFGVDNRKLAAREFRQFLIDEGHPKPPSDDGALQMIQRAERGETPTDRSTIWPYYQRFIGIEEQRPTLEAAMASLGEVDERLTELGILAVRLDEQLRRVLVLLTGLYKDEAAAEAAVAKLAAVAGAR